MHRNFCFLMVVVCIVFIVPVCVMADDLPVFKAATCEKEAVWDAAREAMLVGHGIVRIPAGDCTWQGSAMEIKGNVLLEGAGRGQTLLRLVPERRSRQFFSISDADYTRITGIGFFAADREANDAGTANGIKLTGVENYRINGCHFEGDYNGAIIYKNTPKGVIDNCSFNRTPGYPGSNYGVSPGSSYTPFDEMPKEKCDQDVCTCQVGTAAVDRTASLAQNHTVIVRLDDAGDSAAAQIDNTGGTGDGRIARLYLQVAEAQPDATIDIAAFIHLGDNRFTTRSLAENIPVTEGKNILRTGQDFPDVNIRHGDYIGVSLHHCALDTDATGDESWSLAGDHVPAANTDFGAPSVGNASIYAELFDAQGAYEQCENVWDTWWDHPARPTQFDENWTPGYDKAHYLENSVFDPWRSSVMCANWGNVEAVVLRHNLFRHTSGASFIGLKPGTIFGIIYNNTFEQVGDTSGSAIYPRTSGLIFNNHFINVANTGAWSAYRSYSAYYFTEQLRMKELYIFGNEYTNSLCVEDSSDCFGSFDSRKNRSWIGENATYFFRPPGVTERTYPFVTHEAVIGASHPLTAGDPDVPKRIPDPIPDPPPMDDFVHCEDVTAIGSGWLSPCGVIDACNPENAADLIDQDSTTYYHHWETEPHWITLDLGQDYDVSQIRIYHNQWTTTNAVPEIYVSSNITDWGSSLGQLGAFRDEDSGWKETNLSPKRGRYVRLVSESVASPYWSEIELNVSNTDTPDELGDGGGGGSGGGCFISSLSK